jgi:hypothetical protein
VAAAAGSGTGKAKRIRNNPDVTLAACTARGAVTGPAVRARGADRIYLELTVATA